MPTSNDYTNGLRKNLKEKADFVGTSWGSGSIKNDVFITKLLKNI